MALRRRKGKAKESEPDQPTSEDQSEETPEAQQTAEEQPMAKRKEDASTETETATSESEVPAEQEQSQQAAATPVEIDETALIAGYANFCRVSSTPEELILDLGLNPQPLGQTPAKIKVSQRIILNHYTAKRLLSALAAAIQRYERAFGVLETDIRKRVKTN